MQQLTRGILPEGVTVRDLGEHRLRDLERPERIFELLVPGLPAEFPPLKTLGSYPNNLPLQLSSFIGRGEQLDAVRRLLASARLVTLAGTGGLGKTRLAVQVAADALDDYADGSPVRSGRGAARGHRDTALARRPRGLRAARGRGLRGVR